jgi:hypothetical protein
VAVPATREVVLTIPDMVARRVPDLDVRSGERRTGWTVVEVFDIPFWAFLLLPLGPLSSGLLRLTRHRGVLIELPVTRATTMRRRTGEAVAAAGLAGGLLAVVDGLVRDRGGTVALGVVLLVAGALGATAGLSRLWVRGRMEGDGVRLRGVHRAFADGVAFVREVRRPEPRVPEPLVQSSTPPPS